MGALSCTASARSTKSKRGRSCGSNRRIHCSGSRELTPEIKSSAKHGGDDE